MEADIMTDKNSVKKEDKNFNEKSTCKNKQIIIDGVDVSGCKYLPYCNDKQGNCGFEPNCYFKQLARKTQECEVWKNQVLVLDDENITAQITQEQFEEYQRLKRECEELKEDLKRYERVLKDTTVTKIDYLQESFANQIKADRYRKVFEKIEEFCKEQNLKYDTTACMILSIVNKIKDEN